MLPYSEGLLFVYLRDRNLSLTEHFQVLLSPVIDVTGSLSFFSGTFNIKNNTYCF